MIFILDFDGCITEETFGYPSFDIKPKLRKGVKEALIALKKAGHKLILSSCRNNPHLKGCGRNAPLFLQMINFLKDNGLYELFDEIDIGVGKPYGDVYIDDKALRIGEGYLAVSWKWIKDQYGL